MDLAYYMSKLKPVSAFTFFFGSFFFGSFSRLFFFAAVFISFASRTDKNKHYRTGGDVAKIDV